MIDAWAMAFDDEDDYPAAVPGVVPIARELLCDGETPVGVHARLRRAFGGTCFLLESVVGGERWARYSMIGVGHRLAISGRWVDGRLRVHMAPGRGFAMNGMNSELGELGPLDGHGGYGEGSGAALVQRLLDRYAAAPAPELPRFWGGLVGVWGHDMVRDHERLPLPSRFADASELPAFEFVVTDTVVIFDNLSQRVRVVAGACAREDGGELEARRRAEARIDAVVAALRSDAPALGALSLDEVEGERREWSDRYRAQVEQAKQHIAAGDVFQLVLSQRFAQARAGLDPLDVYRMLRVTNPAPYMFLLELPSATLAGASPEVLVRVGADRELVVRPIAGTRPRGATPELDLALEHELLADAKERAEHLMLIDLGRNDIGRVAAPGTVRVAESFVIERYSKVMHIVSEVVGTLAPGLGALDALRSTFPAGTLSGAPKLRALELIDELEPVSRGWYGGAVGYLGFDGAADFAICIRAVVCVGEELRVQAGAGIVYDSQPAAEDEECRRKAAAVLRAVALARQDSGAPDHERSP